MTRKVSICDISLRRSDEYAGSPLPFRTKIEVAKILAKTGVCAVEVPALGEDKGGYFLVKSLSSALDGVSLCVPVSILDPESPARTWEALSGAGKPRLQVPVPVSTVQMEYFCHRKGTAILQLIESTVAACAALCPDVEFIAEDFSRAEPAFLGQAVAAAVKAGANTVTLGDAAGDLLPDQFGAVVASVKASLPADVRLGAYCSNELHLADACAFEAVRGGADEVKTMAFGNSTVSLKRFARIISAKGDVCGVSCGMNLTGLEHSISLIQKLCDVTRSKSPTAVPTTAGNPEKVELSVHDDIDSVLKVVAGLGYTLSEEDSAKVYDAFSRLASADAVVGAKEIEAIVASVAFQVPSTYTLESFVINTGNIITPTCQIRIRKGEQVLEGVSVGDGPVDAAFTAIEKLLGRHYELDDFQVRSVTEGREALGETLVRLRHDGRVYSGRGVSKDIVGSSLMAYISALNKIAYEEEQA